MQTQESYIKFQCNLVVTKLNEFPLFTELNALRRLLLEQNFIGVNSSDGTGFGNLSVRCGNTNQFIITGTATGGIKELKLEHYVKVIAYDFAQNSLTCEGEIKASSESLSHAAIYESDASVKVVAHIHSLELWQKLLNKAPTTPEEYAYGTPELAYAIKKLFVDKEVAKQKVIVLGGHKDGIMLFANSIQKIDYCAQTILL